MPRRATRTVPTVVLHGLNGPGLDHWCSWLTAELMASGREVRVPALPRSERPDLGQWRATLEDTLTGLPDDGFDLLAHSMASLLWLHHAQADAGAARPARVALVAPPSPTPGRMLEQAPSFFPVPLDADAVRRAAGGTVLVAGDDDPWCAEGAAAAYGLPLRMPCTVIPGGGHLNPDSGYGPWPAVLDWCGRDNLAFIA